jgi:mannose-6-phosphate isomerase-like protein (cupin superfamily)
MSPSPDHDFGCQRFVRGQAGIAADSNGLAIVGTVRGPQACRHDGELLFLFVLQGGALLERAGSVPEPLASGDAVVIPAGQTYGVTDTGGDLELLSVPMTRPLV